MGGLPKIINSWRSYTLKREIIWEEINLSLEEQDECLKRPKMYFNPEVA